MPAATTTRPGSIFVTGAANGIGRATAELFHQRGWRVGMFDVDGDAVAAAAKALRDDSRVSHGTLDVRKAEDWESSLSEFANQAGPVFPAKGGIDVLMNNAGVLSSGSFTDMTDAANRRMVEVNLLGVLNGASHGHSHLLRSRGLLLNMCSASSLYGQPSLATYGATKAAVKSLTEALDLEWRSEGIRVRSLLPMFVATDMVRVDGQQISSMGLFGVRLTAAQVAASAWRVVHQRQWPLRSPHRMVGPQTRVMSSASALSPDWAARLVVRFMSS